MLPIISDFWLVNAAITPPHIVTMAPSFMAFVFPSLSVRVRQRSEPTNTANPNAAEIKPISDKPWSKLSSSQPPYIVWQNLYDIDDGAKTKEDSAALLHTAVQNEIKAIIATPHFNDYSAMDEFVAKRDERVKFLREFIGEKGLDIGLGAGAEVFLKNDVFSDCDLSPLCINGSRYLLCEYTLRPFDPKYAVIYAERVLSMGLVPIIAHPERYRCFHTEKWVAKELCDMGALLQVNASSLAGRGGDEIKDYATELVLSRLADFVATDAHSAVSRPNDIIKCAERFDERITSEDIKRLVYKNPLKVLKDEIL